MGADTSCTTNTTCCKTKGAEAHEENMYNNRNIALMPVELPQKFKTRASRSSVNDQLKQTPEKNSTSFN